MNTTDAISQSEDARDAPAMQRWVLLATGVGDDPRMQRVERALSAALVARGADTHVIRYDEALPACALYRSATFVDVDEFLRQSPKPDMRRSCFGPVPEVFRSEGAAVHRFSEYLTTSDRAAAADVATSLPATDIAGFTFEGLHVGAHAMAAAAAFFDRPHLGTATLEDGPHSEAVVRRYLQAAILTAVAGMRCLQDHAFDVVVCNPADVIPQRPMLAVCAQKGVRVVAWWKAHRQECVMFGEKGINRMLADEPSAMWDRLPLSHEMEAQLGACLESRARGTGDWLLARPKDRSTDVEMEYSRIGINARIPSIGLAPNLRWDATTRDPSMAFTSVREWVFATIQYFARRQDLQLIIRLHPHQVAVAKLAEKLIAEAFPTLPENVVVIPGESPVSTYVVMERCNAVLTWGSTIAVELAAAGIPVVVVGGGWMGGKGFTLDATSRDEYIGLLDRLPLATRLDAPTVRRARQCAYHFFFRHMIPLGQLDASSRTPHDPLMQQRQPLTQGDDVALEVICNGILQGGGFLYPM